MILTSPTSPDLSRRVMEPHPCDHFNKMLRKNQLLPSQASSALPSTVSEPTAIADKIMNS